MCVCVLMCVCVFIQVKISDTLPSVLTRATIQQQLKCISNVYETCCNVFGIHMKSGETHDNVFHAIPHRRCL